MAHIKTLFNENFIQYASYVIRDRAIPELLDGLKPVQRRILHTLLEIDDGRFHKVANVVGTCMKFHPHGDASIYTALVNLANKGLLIDRQGNFGNLFTGDGASAPRYIECRIKNIAREILYNPKITQYVPSYDGRSMEPLVFRAKLPLLLILGAEGIAVGMSTKILTHNIIEVIDAEKKCLQGKKFALFPDFATGGIMDASGYQDGLGKIIVRAKMDLSDEKRIVITELPMGSTSESLADSIEKAARADLVKVASINDYTADSVNIELRLPRGVRAADVLPALYAHTECENTIYCSLLVIRDNMPVKMTVTQVIQYHAEQLKSILHDELWVEKAELLEKLRLRTLERIFIEERIYKKIEAMKTQEAVIDAVRKGFKPFMKEILPFLQNNVSNKLETAGMGGTSLARKTAPLRHQENFDFFGENPPHAMAQGDKKAGILLRAGAGDVPKESLITDEDIDHLLKIPIRRISLYDMEKNAAEVEAINKRLGEIEALLANITAASIRYLAGIEKKLAADSALATPRRTEIKRIEKIDVKETVKCDIPLRYDGNTGYLGTGVLLGKEQLRITLYSKVLFVRKSGIFTVTAAPKKIFAGPGMWWCGIADKGAKVLFTVIYKDTQTGYVFVKRTQIEKYILNRDYFLAPDGMEVLHVDTRIKFNFTVHYAKTPRLKKTEEIFKAEDFAVKSLKAQGVRVAAKAVEKVTVESE